MPLFADAFRLPFPESTIGNRFGIQDGDNYGPQGHRGVDFLARVGTPIPAIANGHVERVLWSNVLGNVTVLRHYLHGDDNDVYSGYAHQSAALVRVGQDVRIGQPIGEVGATGSAATGPHLHLTLSRHELGVISGAVVDPVAYIDELAHVKKSAVKKPVLFTTARRGEGLWAIAQRSHISLPTIERLNPSITGPDYLVLLGQKIRVQ